MEIKKLENKYLKDVAKLCRRTMHRDIMPDFLLNEKVFQDPDFSPQLNYVAVTDDFVAGFISAIIRKRENENVGYIKLIAVDENERRKKIGTLLYKEIENIFLKNGVSRIRVYESYPNYFMPGIDPLYTEAVSFFESKGFTKFNETSNLVVDLLTGEFDTTSEETTLIDQGFIIKRAEPKDQENLLNWIDIVFPIWHDEVTVSFKNKPISLFIALKDGQVVAFSAYETNNFGTGWFGPMGSDPSVRGKGIGTVLLKKCLNAQKDIGYVKSIIPWVGPVKFYEQSVGANHDRSFWRYEKILSKDQ